MTDDKRITWDVLVDKLGQYETENERLKTELAEVKRFLQEMYSPTQRYSDRVVPGYWRQRIERFVK